MQGWAPSDSARVWVGNWVNTWVSSVLPLPAWWCVGLAHWACGSFTYTKLFQGQKEKWLMQRDNQSECKWGGSKQVEQAGSTKETSWSRHLHLLEPTSGTIWLVISLSQSFFILHSEHFPVSKTAMISNRVRVQRPHTSPGIPRRWCTLFYYCFFIIISTCAESRVSNVIVQNELPSTVAGRHHRYLQLKWAGG